MLKKASRKTSKKPAKGPYGLKTTRKPAKAAKGIQYVLPVGNGWVVKSAGALRFTVITDTKREAVSIARGIARNKKTHLIVHNRNGLVQIHETY